MTYTIEVYSATLVPVCLISDPIELTATPRHNEVSTLEFELPATHPKLVHLMDDGARVVLYREGTFVMSGTVDVVSGAGPSVSGTVKILVAGDFRILQQTLGWPNPTAAPASQTSEYWTMTGPVETVVKAIFTQNAVTRLGRAITVAPDLGRGPTITVQSRMQPLYEVLYPTVDQMNIGIEIKQVGTALHMDVYESAVFPMVLTEESGVIQSWTYSSKSPETTNVITGGEGDKNEKIYYEFKDVPLATAWGGPRETYRDARDAASDFDSHLTKIKNAQAAVADAIESGNTTAQAEHQAELDTLNALTAGLNTTKLNTLLKRATETMLEGAPRSGFTVALSETAAFHYGPGGVKVGDTVTVQIGLVTRTDILRECVMSFTHEDGDRTTPIVGNISDNPDRTLSYFLRKLRKGVNELKVAR